MNVLRPLIKSNVALLYQKIALLDLLVARSGAKKASVDFQTVCPIVGASIGQHYRHSMDHAELAALIASSTTTDKPSQPRELHYDLRVRGGTLEKDMVESRKRIMGVIDTLQSIDPDSGSLTSTPVIPYFNLSSDLDEMGLSSTIGRELGFVAHHAIHHMALVKIIAVHTLSIQRERNRTMNRPTSASRPGSALAKRPLSARTTATKNYFERREGTTDGNYEDPPSPFIINEDNYSETDRAWVALLRNSDEDFVYGISRTQKPRVDIVEPITLLGIPVIDRCIGSYFQNRGEETRNKRENILVSNETARDVMKYFGSLLLGAIIRLFAATKSVVLNNTQATKSEGVTALFDHEEDGLFVLPSEANQFQSKMEERVKRELAANQSVSTLDAENRNHGQISEDNDNTNRRLSIPNLSTSQTSTIRHESFWAEPIQNLQPQMLYRTNDQLIEATIDIKDVRINQHPLFTDEERAATQIKAVYELYRERIEARTLQYLLKRLLGSYQYANGNSNNLSQDIILDLVSTAEKLVEECNCVRAMYERIKKLWTLLTQSREQAGFVGTDIELETDKSTDDEFESNVKKLVETIPSLSSMLSDHMIQEHPTAKQTLETMMVILTGDDLDPFKHKFTLAKSDQLRQLHCWIPKEEKRRRRRISTERYFARLVIDGHPVGDTRRVKIDLISRTIKLCHRFNCRLFSEQTNTCCLEVFRAPTGFLPAQMVCRVFVRIPNLNTKRILDERISSVPSCDWYEFASQTEIKGAILVSIGIESIPAIQSSILVRVPRKVHSSQLFSTKKTLLRDSHTETSKSKSDGEGHINVRQLMMAFKCDNKTLMSNSFLEPPRHILLRKRQINPDIPSPIPCSSFEIMGPSDDVYSSFLRQDSEDIQEELIDDALRERSAVSKHQASKVFKAIIMQDRVRFRSKKHYNEIVQDVGLLRMAERKGVGLFRFTERKRSFAAPSSLSLLRPHPRNPTNGYSLLLSIVLGKNLPMKSSDISTASTNFSDTEEIKLGFIVKIQFRGKSYFTRTTKCYSNSMTPLWNDTVKIPLDLIDDLDNLTIALEKETLLITVFDCIDVDMKHQGGFYDDEDTRLKNYMFMGSATIPLETILRNNGHVDGFMRCSSPNHIVGYSRQPNSSLVGIVDDGELQIPSEMMLKIHGTIDPMITAPSESRGHDQWSELYMQGTQCAILWTDMDGVSHLASRFLTEQRPPGIKSMTLEACAHYVSLIPSRQDWKSLAKLNIDQNTVLSCQQTLDILAGNTREHAVLLGNFFLHLSKKREEYHADVYLVLGFSIPAGNTVWVMRKCKSSGKIVFWEATSGSAFDSEDDSIPLQQIYCLVSKENCYGNLQRETKPHSLDFDVSNPRRWAPLHVNQMPLAPIQEEVLQYSPPNQVFARELQEDIKEAIKSAMRDWRRMVTSFRTDLVPKLVSILEKEEKCKLNARDQAAVSMDMSSTTNDIFGLSLHFAYTNIEDVLVAVKATELHANRNPNVEFSIAVRVFAYPGGIMSVWVFICSITPKALL